MIKWRLYFHSDNVLIFISTSLTRWQQLGETLGLTWCNIAWRHGTETLLLANYWGNPSVIGGERANNVGVFFVVGLNKLLSRWFETPWHSCDATVVFIRMSRQPIQKHYSGNVRNELCSYQLRKKSLASGWCQNRGYKLICLEHNKPTPNYYEIQLSTSKLPSSFNPNRLHKNLFIGNYVYVPALLKL